ncbi:MAG: GspH/FimT family pseudopilin [Rhodocyclaceae bacterium]|nr:GspH/FimT family pseudopilin [Rhodocyclaceae bacterium]
MPHPPPSLPLEGGGATSPSPSRGEATSPSPSRGGWGRGGGCVFHAKRQQAGVTIIELMIIVAIVAILASLAAPSFSDFISRMHQASTMTQLTSDLNRARSEAIKRNRRVLVCVRATDTTCGNGTDWRNGWLVCYDEDQDSACDATSTTNPNPMVIHQAINSRLTLTGIAASIGFNPNGTQGTGSATTLTLAGNWTGAVNNVVTIAATGNLSRTP